MYKDQPVTTGIWAMGIPTGMLFTSRSWKKRSEGSDILCLWREFAKLAVCVLSEFDPMFFLIAQYKVLKDDIAR